MEGKSNKTFAIKARLMVALLVVIIICASCNKDEDYRDNFIGKYNCTIIAKGFYLPSDYNIYNWYDTVTVTLLGDSSIILHFSENDKEWEFLISADGHFGHTGYNFSYGHFDRGNFYYAEQTSSMGGNYEKYYYGQKIK